jgi:hypothetical protein
MSPSGRTETTFPPPGWKSEELKPLEDLLTRYVGPMARIMTKKAAAKTVDAQQLVSLMAENISDEEDRGEFLKAALAHTPGLTNPGTSSGRDSGTLSASSTRFGKSILEQSTIDHAAERLAPYVGPIAKVLAKKAAAGATSRTALYFSLAENIKDAEEKAKFLKDGGIK